VDVVKRGTEFAKLGESFSTRRLSDAQRGTDRCSLRFNRN